MHHRVIDFDCVLTLPQQPGEVFLHGKLKHIVLLIHLGRIQSMKYGHFLTHNVHKRISYSQFMGLLFISFSLSVSPESIVIPIVSCIFGFPLLALLVICCLRHRAKRSRERDRRRNYDIQDHARLHSLVRFSPIHKLSKEKR